MLFMSLDFQDDYEALERYLLVGIEALNPKHKTLNSTWAPKVGNIMAFMAVFMGLGLLFSILWGPARPETLSPRP